MSYSIENVFHINNQGWKVLFFLHKKENKLVHCFFSILFIFVFLVVVYVFIKITNGIEVLVDLLICSLVFFR